MCQGCNGYKKTKTNGDKTGNSKKWLPKNFTISAPKQEPQYVSFSASLPPCLCNGFPIYMISTTHTQRLQTRKHFQPKKKGSAQIPDSYFYPYKKYLQHAATKSSQILQNQELQERWTKNTLGLLIVSAFGASITLPDGSSLFLKMLCLCFTKKHSDTFSILIAYTNASITCMSVMVTHYHQ